MLRQYDDPVNATSMGSPNGVAVGALFALYVLCFFSLAFGKKFLSKITWITVLSPVFLMTILVIRSVILPGAGDGIKFYIGKFEWNQLQNMDLWAAACGQILFSLSPGLGAAITLTASAHNKNKNKDPYKVALTIAACNSCFSLIGGIAIFSILGNIAYEDNTSVSIVASRSGTGLAFITLAKGMTNFGGAANVMSVLLFSMLVLLGIDSTFAFLETLLSVTKYISRMYPEYNLSDMKQTGILCIVCFLSGIIFTTRLGIELLDVIDHFVGTYVLLLANFYMGVIFDLDIGFDAWTKAVKQRTFGNNKTPQGRDVWPAFLWKWTMQLTAPTIAGVLFILGFYSDCKKRYALETAPASMVVIGWICLAISIILVLSTLNDKREGDLMKLISNTEHQTVNDSL